MVKFLLIDEILKPICFEDYSSSCNPTSVFALYLRVNYCELFHKHELYNIEIIRDNVANIALFT